jgi:sugar transferase (PEP-CTERM system associated)
MLRLFRHYIPLSLVGRLCADVAVLAIAVAIAEKFTGWAGHGDAWQRGLALGGVVVPSLYIADVYRTAATFSRRELVARLLCALAGAATGMGAVGFAIPALAFSRLAFITVFAVTTVGFVCWRLTWEAIRPAERLRQRVLVIGVGPGATQVASLRDATAQPFSILGFVDDAPDAPDHLPGGLPLLGKTDDLLNLVDELQPDLVLVALNDMRRALPVEDLLECRLRGIVVQDWATFYERHTGKVLVRNLRPSWLIFSDGFVKNRATEAVKRSVDLMLSILGLIVTLPLMALVAMAIKLDSRGPVLFRQPRVGQHGRIFVLNKFRSMTVDAERNGAVWATQNDPRVTRIGKWLRRLRLDELPQFVNVLVGDMSFIGPRPERPEFVRALQRRIPFYMERHSVKPGITGWAQVRHQYAASVEDSLEKLQYDLYYVKNLSPLLDVIILLSTIQVVLFARGSR